MVVLAGGLGTRLQSVLPETPKVLAPVGGRVFLEVVLDWLSGFGAKRVILSLGHRADDVRAHLDRHSRVDMEIETIVEPEPLGTAGAVRLARRRARPGAVMVVNGDSLVDADLCAFLAAHRSSGRDGSILCTRVPDAGRYGAIDCDANGCIEAFREKAEGQGGGLINAGLYLMNPPLLDLIDRSDGPSLERDIFQKLPPGTLCCFSGSFAFLDIGTPDDFTRAGAFLVRFA